MASVEELLQPIPGPSPGGENIRYTQQFDKLKEARRQGGDWLSEDSAVDYGPVIKLSEEILLKKSKDLQVAAWLAEGWLAKQGFSGFRNGLLVLHGLVENFWDTLYPEMEDGDEGLRLAPLDWAGAYLELPLRQAPLTKGGHNLLQYKESQMIGGPPDPDQANDDPEWDKKRAAFDAAVAEGKTTSDVFDAGLQKTSKDFLIKQVDELTAILGQIQTFQELCEQKFKDEQPSFSKIRSALDEILVTASSLLEKKRIAEPDADTEESGETASAEEGEGAEAGAVTVGRVKKRARVVAGLEPESPEDAADRLAAIAAWLRVQDPQNPAPYLLLRGYRWGELRASGASAPDPLLLDPPPTEMRVQVKRLSLESSWEEVIQAGESVMASPGGRGWLDLQRFIVQACENQGYSAVAAAIKSSLKSLLTDMPDLLNMMLMDDSPAANAETAAWIRENILPPEPLPQPETTGGPEEYEMFQPAAGPALQGSDGQQGEMRPPDAFELAQEALRTGNKEQAIEILVREMALERSGRARFHRKMQLAQICLSIGRQMVARPILEDMASEIATRKLDEWEPAELVAHTLALLYRCLEGDSERKQQIYSWICRLDPMQALACLK
ncbi:MAG: type VI secretion system protein TssA [Acidobacteria bacterium]|nr:type VI secretion system protein TssA [Acidobacteriota bacterium]